MIIKHKHREGSEGGREERKEEEQRERGEVEEQGSEPKASEENIRPRAFSPLSKAAFSFLQNEPREPRKERERARSRGGGDVSGPW